MSQEFFNTLLWVRLCMGMKKHTPNRARCFVRKKYTTFCTERIVALRSVNKIVPEIYDFAANKLSIYYELSLNVAHFYSLLRMSELVVFYIIM
jgi:hypothetical protein